jgi:hypothetical protein
VKRLLALTAVALAALLARAAQAVPPAPSASASAPPAPAASSPTFPIAITVAVENGAPARDDAWIATQIDDANALYAPRPIDVRFRRTLRKEMSAVHAQMHTREDRDALGALMEKNVIDVFVVAALEDVDEPGRYRKGVAWTQRTTGARYIILSAAAPRTVLAHELGHFFGNGHSSVPDNLMSYTRTGGKVFLDDDQVARVHAFAAKFLAAGRLADVGPGNSPAISDAGK